MSESNDDVFKNLPSSDHEYFRKQRSDKFYFTDQDLVELESLGARMVPLKAMAHYFGISTSTLMRRIDDEEEAKAALRRGRSKALIKLNTIGLKKAFKGDPSMLKYYISKYERSFMTGVDNNPILNSENQFDFDREDASTK